MIIILFTILLSLSSFSIFSLTYKINGINRTIINLPMSIFAYAVPLNEEEIYFDTDKLEDKLDEYLDQSLLRFVDTYQKQYDYYSSSTSSYCLDKKCDIVRVSVNCQIDGYYFYHRVMKYALKEMI